MAGKRQHYVPRFLQRGFLAEPENPTEESERTWLHRLGAPARRVGIGDVGVEDWFYSRKGAPGDLNAITALLDAYGPDGFPEAWLKHRGLGWAAELVAAERTHSPAAPQNEEITA